MFKVDNNPGIFVVNFQQISHIILVFEQVYVGWDMVDFEQLFSSFLSSFHLKKCSSFLRKSITAQKMRFSTNNSFSKYDQANLQETANLFTLLNKSLMENFIFI